MRENKHCTWVFGEEGFIGSYLIRESKKESELVGAKVDIASPFSDLYGGFDSAVNLACVQPARGKFTREQYTEINVNGLKNILNMADSTLIGQRKVIGVFSQKTKGTGEMAKFLDAEARAMKLLRAYSGKLNTIILRIPPAYGPGPFIKGTGLGTFLQKASKGEPIAIWGNPEVRWDIISVHDVVSAIQCLLKNKSTKGEYRISGINLSLQEEVDTVNAVFGNRSPITYSPEIPNKIEPSNVYFEQTPIPGWLPTWNLRRIIKELKGVPETWS